MLNRQTDKKEPTFRRSFTLAGDGQQVHCVAIGPIAREFDKLHVDDLPVVIIFGIFKMNDNSSTTGSVLAAWEG